MVYCLSGGRKDHPEVLIKSVPCNSCVAEVPHQAHQGAVGVVAALLEMLHQGISQEFAAWCGDLVSFQVSQNQCSCRELCWGLLLQAGSGAQRGDEQARILVQLLGAGCHSAPTGEWTRAWRRAQTACAARVCCTLRLGKVKCWASEAATG